MDPLRKMIAEGEHLLQDFKYCINDSRKIARSLVAFANSNGGRLLLGVRDNGSIAGVKSEEEYYMVEAAAKLYSQPPLEFTTRQWYAEGKSVLEIGIAKGTETPYFAKDDENRWQAYVRSGDQNIVAPKLLTEVWKKRKSTAGVKIKYTDDEKRLLQLVENEGNLSPAQIARRLKLPRWKSDKLLVDLIVVDVIAFDLDEHGIRFFLNENLTLGIS